MVESKEKFDKNKEVDLFGDDLEMEEGEQSFSELFESSIKELNVGDVVEGTIVQINPDTVVVDVGYKSEGIIPLAELADENGEVSIEVGDKIDVLFERRENENGLIGLSKEKADRQKIWNGLEEDAVVEGRIVNRIKGGLSVDIGVTAFLPGSQVDLRPVRNLDKLLGETFEFKIIKLNKRRGNIVLSRRVLLEDQRESQRKDTLATLAEGQEVDGVVKISPITVRLSTSAASTVCCTLPICPGAVSRILPMCWPLGIKSRSRFSSSIRRRSASPSASSS